MPHAIRRSLAIPTAVVFRGIPLPRADRVPTTSPATEAGPGLAALALGGIATEAVQLARVQRETEALLRHYRARLRRGDRGAMLELLDRNPAFITVTWVRDAFGQLLIGGLALRRRGRPRGRYLRSPLVVVGLVRHLIDIGRAENPEQAFGIIDEVELLSYDAAKRAYYQARRDSRFRPIWLQDPELAREVTDEPASRTAPVLRRGMSITTALGAHPLLGPLHMTLRGE